MPRIVRLLCLLVVSTHAVVAGERPVSRPGVLRLSHETALQMALAKSFAIQVERFEPRIAGQLVRSAAGRFDPELSASWERTEDTERDVFLDASRLSAGASTSAANIRRNAFVDSQLHLSRTTIARRDAWRVGFGGETPWGLRYDLGLGTDTLTGTGNFWSEDFTTSAGLTLRQPLLRDFGPAANLNLVRVARNNARVSEWALRDRIIDILTQTDAAYNTLHAAHESLKAAERSRSLALRLLADNEARVKIGVKSPLDVTEARAEAAAREENVIRARRLVRDSENLLKQLVTNDLESMLAIQVEIEPPPSPAFVPDVPAGIRDALTLRPDYRQALLALENRNITLAFRRNQTLPRLDLTASLELLGFDNDFGTSLDRVPRRDQTIWTVGAIVSIPIPNREARGNQEAARLQVAQQMIALQELEQQIVVEVDNASGAVVTARELIAANGEARRLAQESLDAGEERLQAGVATTFVVLELQTKLAEAEDAEIRARAQYNTAVARYYQRTGTSLRVYNVSVH